MYLPATTLPHATLRSRPEDLDLPYTSPVTAEMSALEPHRSPFEALPRYLATSILSYAASDDWLYFRLASRASFEIVHGTTDVSLRASGDGESESLWRLALIRDYRFGEADDCGLLHRSIRVDRRSDAFLSTNDVFTASNSFHSWKHWRKIDLHLHHHRSSPRGSSIPSSEQVVGPYFLRAASMWGKIERWCDDENRSGTLGPEIKASLSPGRPLDPNSGGRVRDAKTSALKAVYAFYSGQCDPMMHAPSRQPQRFNPFIGLFGGFQAYHVVSSTRWMEPEFGGFGQPEQEPLGGDARPYLVIAQGEMKVFVMDLISGYIRFLPEGNVARALLATPVSTDRRDSMLCWFEEHADRLDRNLYSVGNIISNIPGGRGQTLHSLLRYPTLADTDNCSRAVTRGVEVAASAIYVPEMGMFVYSIRMRLLAPEDGDGYASPQERGFNSCQLVSRHWRIGKFSLNSSEPRIEEVRGEGVIGFYPLLNEGKYTNYDHDGYNELEEGSGFFSYQSCTEADVPGFLEGSLQFLPGSVKQPRGDAFDVQVARFPLKSPRFLY